jgi:hypothetical protein
MAIYAQVKDGVVVNTLQMESTDVQDPSFTWADITSVNPPPSIGWLYDGTTWTNPVPVPPPATLSQTYTPSDYGQLLIKTFTDNNNNHKALTNAQDYALAQELGPLYLLLQTGSLEAALAGLVNINVDGVMITNADIAQFTGAIQAYLGGQ